MQKLLLTLALVACALAAVEAKKPPKSIRTLRVLCERATGDKGLTITDANFTEVFEMLEDEFCLPFLQIYNMTYPGRVGLMDNKYDPIKALGGVCKWVDRKYTEEPEGLLMGVVELCYEYEVALNTSLGLPVQESMEEEKPAKTPAKVKRLIKLCEKSEDGKLNFRNSSYDAVAAEFATFCTYFLEEYTAPASVDGKMKKGVIQQLDEICIWFGKKYPTGDDGGPFDGFDDFCESFYEV